MVIDNAHWPEADLEDLQNCPVCESKNYSLFYHSLRDETFEVAPGKWNLMRCHKCSTLFLNPRPTEATIGRAYANYFTHLPSTTMEISSKPSLRLHLWNGYVSQSLGYNLTPAYSIGNFLMRLMPYRRMLNDRTFRNLKLPKDVSRPRLLDVGCGNGTFLNFIQKFGWDGYGIDTDVDAVALASQLGLRVVNTPLLPNTFPQKFFDGITLNHVIEHVHDPVALLKTCRNILKPSGLLWIATPNVRSFSHRRFSRHWRGIESPRHVVLFTPRSLSIALERAGFEISKRYGSPSDLWMYKESWRLRSLGTDRENDLPSWMQVEAALASRVSAWNPNIGSEIIVEAKW